MLSRLINTTARFGHRTSTSSSRYASTLILAEHDNVILSGATLNAVTAAKTIGGDITVLVAGSGSQAVADAASKIDGVTSVLHADNEAYGNGIAENITNAVLAAQEASSYSHIVAAASPWGKNVLPRVAVKLDVAVIGDVMKINSDSQFVRPAYAGNAIQTVSSSESVKVLTVRPTNFDAAAAEGGSASVSDSPSAGSPDAGLTSWVNDEIAKSDRPDLGSAGVVVAGGRGMKNGENFEMLYTLADKLGGAVGASRAAVDAGYVANDLQIGQTGKVVAPDLYVAAGISGAIQHLAGMKDSKCIVAINKDPEAPIFQVADYGLVDDLFKAVPDITSKV
jgi:electron transfer flavoprotein alpha subunit